jgi:ankyrin repeat protein
MNVPPPPPPPPQDDDPIITQFKPRGGQWDLNDHSIKRIGDETGSTILHNYCCYINTTPLGVYRYLIEVKGCDINARDKYNDTPVHLAFGRFDPNEGGNITVLMYLLSQMNINANTGGYNGETLLHDACKKINKLPLDIFKVLIETMGCDVNALDKYSNTPPHHALRLFDPNKGGDITILTYLLNQKSVNGNIKDLYGYTLLHTACYYINKLPIDIFKLLIETLCCDVNAQDDRNDTPLHDALRLFDPNKGGDITALAYLFSQEGIDGNITGESGFTLLHMACKNARKLPVDVFKLLIETQGFDVNAVDNDKNTPFHLAFHDFDPINDSNITVFAYLINRNSFNVNIKDQDGCTFLHLACTSGISELNNFSDSEDEFSDPDDDGDVLEAKSDTVLSQIVEIIAERCVEQVFNESSS